MNKTNSKSARCRNPECVNGVTPGVVVVGKGDKFRPILGQRMTWSWVPCPLCKPVKETAGWKPMQRTTQEIAARADLATRKAPYVKEDVATRLSTVKPTAPDQASRYQPSDDQPRSGAVVPSAVDTKKDETIAGLSQAVTRLLAENAELRSENVSLKESLMTTSANYNDALRKLNGEQTASATPA